MLKLTNETKRANFEFELDNLTMNGSIEKDDQNLLIRVDGTVFKDFSVISNIYANVTENKLKFNIHNVNLENITDVNTVISTFVEELNSQL